MSKPILEIIEPTEEERRALLASLPDSARLELTEAVAAQGATGQRITLTRIQNSIASVLYMIPGAYLDQPEDSALNRMTLCFLTTFSGFVVVGKSAPMDPTNFDAKKGRLFAYEDAVRQLWPLHAFAALEMAEAVLQGARAAEYRRRP